jgi:hypothetical protein
MAVIVGVPVLADYELGGVAFACLELASALGEFTLVEEPLLDE